MDPWVAIWARLTDTERRAAVHEHLLQMEKFPDVRASAIQYLAQELRTTREAVARWPLERRADRLARSPSLRPEYLSAFVAALHVKQRAPMLARFLDTAGIPNLNGVIDPRTVQGSCPTEMLVEAVRVIQREFPAREVELYLDALEAQRNVQMENLRAARREAGRPLAEAAQASPDAVPKGAARPPDAGVAQAVVPAAPPLVSDSRPQLEPARAHVVEPPPALRIAVPRPSLHATQVDFSDPIMADPEALTPLDDLLCATALASSAGIEGALPLERLRAVIEEVLRLNGERHRSYYHLGFLDVLQGRTPDAQFPQASERHRGWYLCGAVHALARKGDAPGIAALLDRHPADARRLLGDRHEACCAAVLPLFDALCTVGRRSDALRALVPTAVSRAGEPLMERLLNEAAALLRAGQAAEAMPVLTLLSDGIEARQRRSFTVAPGLVERAALKRALAQRQLGSFDLARQAFEGLGASEDPAVVGEAQAGLGLAVCRVRSVSDVRLPRRAADLAATAHALEPGAGAFRSAHARPGHGGVLADVCLGTLLLAQGRVEEARPHLERAVAATQDEGALDEGYGVAARLRLYLGLALAESLDAGRAAEAVERLVAGVRGVPEEAHPYLLARALTALATTKPDLGAVATEELHSLLGDRLLDAALEAGLLPAHEALREVLARRAEDASRPRRARGADAEALLRDALAGGDVARAERALVTLEDLSDDAEGRARLLGLLGERTRYDPAWTAEEALDARVRLLEAEGRYREAALLLCGTGHEALSRDPERGLFLVSDVLARIEGYGIECPDPALVARRNALRSQERAPPVASTREPVGSVYVIGGNEVQAQYEGWLRAEAQRRWPRVTLEFDFTGWSSNWGRALPAIEGRIRNAQAVVVLRFIRTMLGRAVRSICGTHGRPWVACTGHGRQSLLLAIEQAVAQCGTARGT